jgi:hypothetical protein
LDVHDVAFPPLETTERFVAPFSTTELVDNPSNKRLPEATFLLILKLFLEWES